MKKALVIINPRAGTQQANHVFVDIAAMFNRHGYAPTVMATEAHGDATRLASELGANYDMVVAIGGDGTFNEVVDGLLLSGIKIPVGYIPAGSTNDFGSSLGIPKNLLMAARDIVTGVPANLDIGKFNERYFSYVASFGAFTQTSYSAPQDMKNLLGHTAYILEGIRDIPSIRPQKLRLKNEVGIYGSEYIFGAICNSTSMGGIITLDPALVDMNDGKLEVLLIKSPKNILELTTIVSAITQGHFRDCPMMSFFSSRRVEIEADPDMPWTLDGEYQEGQEHIVIEAKQSAIQLILSEQNAARLMHKNE